MFRINAFGDRMTFLSEKQNKPYVKYGAASIAGKNVIGAKKSWQSNRLCRLVGQEGA